ncbi:phage holin family protein [Chishuiella sp.]|uniref:phage holin family protein n=1 Tax=Chishuiella sp. TaxID=1969467 RepID=UPI0028AB00FF|nr:phage holin family protein [Chishuiella sp.]
MRLYECFGTDATTGNIIKCFFYGFFAIINLNYDLAIFLFVAMIIDMVLGVIKAIVLNENISPKLFMFGFATKLLLLIIPFTVSVLGIALNMNFTWTADLAVRVLLANECLSILANILSVKNRKKVENIDLVTIFISWIRKTSVSTFEKFLNNQKKEE